MRKLLVFLIAVSCILLSVYQLEHARSGIQTQDASIGTTPATFYQLPALQQNAPGPLVIVAHGFAGSRQIMQAYSLTLARAGYQVLAFDFEGHGRNPVPMSGDVTVIEGTTRLLVNETRRVIEFARQTYDVKAGLALLGHSMATDVLLRAALAEEAQDQPIDTIVGLSMFSEAITESEPDSLLIINGQWEHRLRAPALAQLRLLKPDAQEGDTVRQTDVTRRVAVAPYIEHVSILYSTSALRESLMWMDDTFGRSSDSRVVGIGGWILLLLIGVVLAFKPLVNSLNAPSSNRTTLDKKTFWLAILVPALLSPLMAFLPELNLLPVLVADYLMIHLLTYGLLQILIIRWRTHQWLSGGFNLSAIAVGVLILWGTLVFGLAVDRYLASYLPTSGRLSIVAVLCLGTVLFTVADAVVTDAGRAQWWRRLLARVALIVSLSVAATIDPDRLIFLLLIVPVLVLFYGVHGLMGRWVAQRFGALTAGVGLGICMAWALGVSFPLFDLA